MSLRENLVEYFNGSNLVETEMVFTCFKESGKYYSEERVSWPVPWYTDKSGVLMVPDVSGIVDYYLKEMKSTPGLANKWADGYVVISFVEQHPPVLLKV